MRGFDSQRGRKIWRLLGIILAALVVLSAGLLIGVSRWAFSREKVAKALGQATSSTVEFRTFRHVYFPRPGCVAEGVTFRRPERSGTPLIAATRLVIVDTFAGILKSHVSLIEAEGVEVTASDGWPSSSASAIEVERLVAKNAVLLVPRKSSPALRFAVHDFSIEDLGGKDAMRFHVALTNPIPRGEVVANGRLGPWNRNDRAETPISGSYSFRDADVATISGIGGLLSSDGEFHGSIRQLEVQGSTDTPEFEIVRTGHRFPLSTQFAAVVNATNGEVVLNHVDAHVMRTNLEVQGSIKREPPDHRRTAMLDIFSRDGRIQDVLFPFVHEPRSPLNGVTNFHARVVLPSGKEPFLHKVVLQAEFGIDAARFTSAHTQAKVNKMSESARGNPDEENPEDVVSDLRGRVLLKNGVATFSNLTFRVPGASAAMHGTFNMISQHVDLHGTVQLQAKVSDTTTGFKSFLIKALSPFIKKDKPREPLPVAITGTYSHPQYSVSLTSKKKQARGGE